MIYKFIIYTGLFSFFLISSSCSIGPNFDPLEIQSHLPEVNAIYLYGPVQANININNQQKGFLAVQENLAGSNFYIQNHTLYISNTASYTSNNTATSMPAIKLSLQLPYLKHIYATKAEYLNIQGQNASDPMHIVIQNSKYVSIKNCAIKSLQAKHVLDLNINQVNNISNNLSLEDTNAHICASNFFNQKMSVKDGNLTVCNTSIKNLEMNASHNAVVYFKNVHIQSSLIHAGENSSFYLLGNTQFMTIAAQADSYIDASHFFAQDAFIKTNDQARVDVNVSQVLRAAAAQKSKIYYYQRPLLWNWYAKDSSLIAFYNSTNKKVLP